MKKNRFMMSRKAMVFNIMIVIFTIIALTYAFVRLSAKMDVSQEIGENQFEVITKIQEGEKALIFVDFAAKMAMYQAVYDLQAQGGITETAACGTYYGFNRWNAESGETCFVDSSTAKDSLRDLFVSNLVARLAAYPSADFVSNIPEAAFVRGEALAATQPPVGEGIDYSKKILSDEEKYTLLASLAKKYGFEFAVLKAFLMVEAAGKGFGPDGRLKIRMEPHVFNKRCECEAGTWGESTRKDRAISGVSCEGGQEYTHACLAKAATINEDAAYKSISMGLPQIMGFHHKRLGYPTPKAMFDDFSRSEAIQLEKFIEFLSKGEKISAAIRAKDWAEMARIYNGDTTGRYASRLQTNYHPEEAAVAVA